jgi:hypothetical protein
MSISPSLLNIPVPFSPSGQSLLQKGVVPSHFFMHPEYTVDTNKNKNKFFYIFIVVGPVFNNELCEFDYKVIYWSISVIDMV